jgi:small membrane protein
MIIQFIITASLLFVIIYAYRERRNTRFISEVMISISLTGVALVWFPELATSIASKVGVGRGADLILYLFIVVMFAIAFVIHLRLRALDRTVTVLAREIAISRPMFPEKTEGRRDTE